MSESAGEKSFEATSHRRQEARDKGQVAFSQDLGSAALLLLGVFLLMMLGGGVVQFSAGLMEHQLGDVPDKKPASQEATQKKQPEEGRKQDGQKESAAKAKE